MIILSGPSASGKTEVAKRLASKYNITKIITTTTRKKRRNEKNGVDYFFVTKKQFDKMIQDDKFVEYTEYNSNFYGSTKDQIADNKCLVVDLEGLKKYSNLKNKKIVSFFLEAKETTRYNRMIYRGDEVEKAKSRIQHDRIAFKPSNIPNVDFKVDSETLTIEQIADKIHDIYCDFIKNK